MTTVAPPALYFDDAWSNWVMGRLMEMWAQQAQSEHDLKEIRDVAHR
jgi:hypothetical protein